MLQCVLVLRSASDINIGSKKGGTMAARIDSTICRKRPKKRQGTKR